MKLATRMKAFSTSIFSELSIYIKQKCSEKKDMIDLSVGSPDLPPPPFVMEALSRYASDPKAYGYTLKGTREFYEAVAFYYQTAHPCIASFGNRNHVCHRLTRRPCSPANGICGPRGYYSCS
jgi:aspartate/methionine/tyrosine aminotransferase